MCRVITRAPRHLLTSLAGPATVAVLVAGSLSACSVAGTDFQPGVAARVGTTTITADEVDSLSRSACEAFRDQLEQSNQVVPLRTIKGSVLQSLAVVSATRQLGQEYGVRPGEAYRREVAQARATAGDRTAAELRAIEVVQTSSSLISDVLGRVGVQLAASTDGTDLEPDSDQAIGLGQQELSKWLGDHDVDVDPQYGISIDADGVAPVDTSTSFAVSEAAQAGAAAEADQAATMALPDSQRCGSYSGSGAG